MSYHIFMYLNDIEEKFYLKGFKGIDTDSVKLFLLLYADDMIFFFLKHLKDSQW